MKPSRNTTVTSGPVNGTPSGVSRTNATTASRRRQDHRAATYAPTRVRPACALDVSRSACHGSSWLVSQAQPRSPSWRRKNRRNAGEHEDRADADGIADDRLRGPSARSSRIADSTRSKAAITPVGDAGRRPGASPRSVRPLVTRSISSRRYGRNAPIISATTTTRPSRPATHAAADARDRDRPRRRRRSTVGTRGAATTSAQDDPHRHVGEDAGDEGDDQAEGAGDEHPPADRRHPVQPDRDGGARGGGRRSGHVVGGRAALRSWRQMGVSPPSPSS